MQSSKKSLLWGALSFLFGAALCYSQDCPILDSYFESIRQTAMIILGIIGAWIAVLFPFLYGTKGFNNSEEFLQDVSSMLDKLLATLKYSVYIVCLAILAPLAKYVLLACGIHDCYIFWLKVLGFGCLTSLIFFMIYTLIRALDPFVFVITTIKNKREEKDLLERKGKTMASK